LIQSSSAERVIGSLFGNFRVSAKIFFETLSRVSGWVIGRVAENFRVWMKKFRNFFPRRIDAKVATLPG
jgi:hypothetical protein